MNVRFDTPASLHRFIDCLNGPRRRNLFSVAANALKILVQNHVRANAPRHHRTAQRLAASPTRLHEKGAARIVGRSTSNAAEVVIPIVGIGRAFHDVTISPVAARALTIPLNAHAYGHRVAELQRMGWMVFRPKGADVLMGYQKDMTKKKSQKTPIPLYALKRQVQQRQDRSLLPSDQQIKYTVARAMMMEIQRISRAA